METIDIFALGFLCFVLGGAFGAWLAWHRWLKHERPVLHINVDTEVLQMVSQQMAMDWAERRGLTWMPKGAVFDLGKKNETPR